MIEKHGKKYRIRKMVKGKSYILTFDQKPTKSDIELKLAEQISIEAVNDDDRTYEECALDYIRINRGVLSPLSIEEKENAINRLPEDFRKTKIKDITQQMVQELVSNYASELSPRYKTKRSPVTVRNFYGQISVILKKYAGKSYSINLPQRKPKESYMPTEKDIMTLLAYIKGTELEIPFMLAAFGSLREGEVCALTMDDVKDNMVHVNKIMYRDTKEGKWKIKDTPKTSKSNRYSAIPHKLQTMIHKKGYIYKHSPNRLLKQLNEAQDACRIPRFSFHTLRSYYASASHSLGIPDEYIMKNGGWKSTQVLQEHYRKALSDKQKKMDKKLVDHFSSIM